MFPVSPRNGTVPRRFAGTWRPSCHANPRARREPPPRSAEATQEACASHARDSRRRARGGRPSDPQHGINTIQRKIRMDRQYTLFPADGSREGRETIQSVATQALAGPASGHLSRSATLAKPAFAQSASCSPLCAPLTEIAPSRSSPTLMGMPPFANTESLIGVGVAVPGGGFAAGGQTDIRNASRCWSSSGRSERSQARPHRPVSAL